MHYSANIKQLLLLIGDFLLLVGSLALAVIIRGRTDLLNEFQQGSWGWGITILIWIGILAFSGLYNLKRMRNSITFINTFIVAIGIATGFSVLFFYIIPLGIAPKTTLVIFAALFIPVGLLWRRWFTKHVTKKDATVRTAILGGDVVAKKLAHTLKQAPHLGYHILGIYEYAEEIPNETEIIIVPRGKTQESERANALYVLLAHGVTIRNLDDVYMEVYGKMPLQEVSETWLLEHASQEPQLSRELQQAVTYALAVLLQILFIPLELLIALAIKLTSKGPVIYKQIRTGRDGKPFTLYKFRTMYEDAEEKGPQWARKKDPRVTPIGAFLRHTHLDEFPQLFNILKGELSFVGPRPERPEFEQQLEKEIPYYKARQLVHPGITGWAQVSYRYSSTIEHAKEKLEYDLYYLRYRSATLDVFILLKTIKTLFTTPK